MREKLQDAGRNCLREGELSEQQLTLLWGGNLIGNQLEVIGIASQNSAINYGNTGASVSHSVNTQNTAQQVVIDAQSIDILKNVEVLAKPLILV